MGNRKSGVTARGGEIAGITLCWLHRVLVAVEVNAYVADGGRSTHDGRIKKHVKPAWYAALLLCCNPFGGLNPSFPPSLLLQWSWQCGGCVAAASLDGSLASLSGSTAASLDAAQEPQRLGVKRKLRAKRGR